MSLDPCYCPGTLYMGCVTPQSHLLYRASLVKSDDDGDHPLQIQWAFALDMPCIHMARL